MISTVNDPSISNGVVFAISVIVGMLGHYAKKRAKLETATTVFSWFGTAGVYGSISTVVASSITILGALSNNIITADMSISTVMYIGLTTGFVVDSTTNNDGIVRAPLENQPESRGISLRGFVSNLR